MATSPLFGWEEPDDIDLVKDGAAAMRTLGNAIDTSMGDLLGGTTGQVLSKASNTNMDFAWVAQDDTNAIQNAIVDAKGDLITATAADTPARLALGTTGQVLKVNTATATGLEWGADNAGMSNPMTTTGDIIYSSPGSTPVRRGIGTTGQVLTVSGGIPTWATPSGSGSSFTLLNAGGTSLTGSSTSITGLSGYNQIFIVVNGAGFSSANTAMQITFNSDTGTNYSHFGAVITPATAVASSDFNQWNQASVANIRFGMTAYNSGSRISGFMKINGCNTSTIKTFNTSSGASASGSNVNQFLNTGGVYTGTSVISSVQFKSGDTFTAGTAFIYGSVI